MAKYDFSDAYRRVSHSPAAAAATILIIHAVAYIFLRLTFGGAANPPAWCAFSEAVTDLSNEIPLCPDWDPEDLCNPCQASTPEPLRYCDPDAPLGQSKPMAVHVPTTVTAITDSFIDDLIRVFLDTEWNRRAQPHAVPLAVYVTNRPHAGDQEPVTRRENLSIPKLKAEGTPTEAQIVLGWELDAHRLLLRLPFDKYVAWVGDLQEVLNSTTISLQSLDSLIGRLNHAAYVVPLARHFL